MDIGHMIKRPYHIFKNEIIKLSIVKLKPKLFLTILNSEKCISIKSKYSNNIVNNNHKCTYVYFIVQG